MFLWPSCGPHEAKTELWLSRVLLARFQFAAPNPLSHISKQKQHRSKENTLADKVGKEKREGHYRGVAKIDIGEEIKYGLYNFNIPTAERSSTSRLSLSGRGEGGERTHPQSKYNFALQQKNISNIRKRVNRQYVMDIKSFVAKPINPNPAQPLSSWPSV